MGFVECVFSVVCLVELSKEEKRRKQKGFDGMSEDIGGLSEKGVDRCAAL